MVETQEGNIQVAPQVPHEGPAVKGKSGLLIVLTICVLLSININRSVTPIWLDGYPHSNNTPPNATDHNGVRIDAYFFLLWGPLLSSVIFGVLLGLLIVCKPGYIGEREYNYPKKWMYIPTIFGPIGTIMTNFPGDGKRTPAYLQPIMVQARIPMVFLMRFLILKRYPTLRKNLCAVAVVVAVFISLLPRIFPNLESSAAKHEEGGTTGVAGVLWPLCIALSEVPFAIGASFLELGLKHNQHRGISNQKEVNILYYMFWNSLFCLLNTLCLFWADIIPGFGYLTSIDRFWDMIKFNILCVFGGNACGVQAIVAFQLKFAARLMGGISRSLFLRYSEGANFLSIVSALQGPMLLLFWTLFREDPFQWQPEMHLSTWLALLALAIILPAIYVYSTGPPERTLNKRQPASNGPRETDPLLAKSEQVT